MIFQKFSSKKRNSNRIPSLQIFDMARIRIDGAPRIFSTEIELIWCLGVHVPGDHVPHFS